MLSWLKGCAEVPAQTYWLEQCAGDIVFVPHSWWHCVVNLETSVAYTRNFVNKTNVRQAIDELAATHPDISQSLRQHALAVHS